MKRWQNYGLWVAVASLLFMIVQDLGFHVTIMILYGYTALRQYPKSEKHKLTE